MTGVDPYHVPNASQARALFRLMQLVVSEWRSDPLSVQCFDLRIVEEARALVEQIQYESRQMPKQEPEIRQRPVAYDRLVMRDVLTILSQASRASQREILQAVSDELGLTPLETQ